MNTKIKHTRRISPCLALLAFFTTFSMQGCYRSDVRTEIIKVPAMGTEACASALEGRLAKVGGMQRVSADPYALEVEVVFNARRTSRRNVEHHIADFGFDVEAQPLKHEMEKAYVIPGNATAKARLPAECR